MIRQPVGVVAAITPFNFPAMIPFWFLPYAIACGNTFILKPSEKVPLTSQRLFELLQQLELPAGVLNLVHGGKAVVGGLIQHPGVRAISFVGSTPVAKYIYQQSAAYGKRVQCQGGAKNHVLVLDDADLESASRIVSDSAFGCASGSTSESRRRWPIFRSADGEKVSSATFMPRAAMRSTSIPRRKSWWNAGRKSGLVASRLLHTGRRNNPLRRLAIQN